MLRIRAMIELYDEGHANRGVVFLRNFMDDEGLDKSPRKITKWNYPMTIQLATLSLFQS